ncbi:MAG: long-chain acyl-CoA synthetase, partial [bacterium]
MSGNLAAIMIETAARHGDRPAYKLDDVVVPWSAVDEGSARVAGLLREKGMQPGDRVGVMLPNVPYFPIAYYGILRAGGVVVPMNVLLKGREVSFYLQDPGAKLLLCWEGFTEAAAQGAEEAGAEVITVAPGEFEKLLGGVEAVREVAEVADDDTAVILYTSGTTGKPKGAELTHDNLRRNAAVSVETLLKMDERDVLLGALPLFHTFGQTVCMNCSTLVGACLTMIPRFDPGKALEIIERDQVTVFAGVPTMYTAMLNHPDHGSVDVSCLRLCVSGGAAMPEQVMRSFEHEFGCTILEGYGLSETSPVASFNHPDKALEIIARDKVTVFEGVPT